MSSVEIVLSQIICALPMIFTSVIYVDCSLFVHTVHRILGVSYRKAVYIVEILNFVVYIAHLCDIRLRVNKYRSGWVAEKGLMRGREGELQLDG